GRLLQELGELLLSLIFERAGLGGRDGIHRALNHLGAAEYVEREHGHLAAANQLDEALRRDHLPAGDRRRRRTVHRAIVQRGNGGDADVLSILHHQRIESSARAWARLRRCRRGLSWLRWRPCPRWLLRRRRRLRRRLARRFAERVLRGRGRRDKDEAHRHCHG